MDNLEIVGLVYMAFFVIFSMCSYAAMVIDKQAAENGGWRISESRLHLLEFLGGWFGSMIAQVLYRHKVKKCNYQIIFWIIVILHISGTLALAASIKIRSYSTSN